LARSISQAAADFRRRINETYSKAVSQLASAKLEERLGGIYTLENISKESPDDYWTVMENLTAFVRERTRPEAKRLAKPLDRRIAERAYLLWEQAGRPEGRDVEFWSDGVRQEEDEELPATDIAAVLTVIKRRDEEHRALEIRDKRILDVRQAVLRRASLDGAHLEGADLTDAHLERASLNRAHLEKADLTGAHLEGARLFEARLEGAHLADAHLEGAHLTDAHLEGAHLFGAHLENADLTGAHLEDARLFGAHLEGADLTDATGLAQDQIDEACGDAATQLPKGLSRPEHWTAPKQGAAPEQRDLP
jgi:uncharacterized protein YjbI with pentapeptide repeats